MSARFAERFLWAGSLAMALIGAWRLTRPAGATPAVAGAIAPLPSAPAMFDADSLAQYAERATDGNLFREDRSRTPEHIAEQSTALAPHPTTPVPPLSLRGIIGGPPWDVVLDGIPGRSAGTVLRDGETVAGFTVAVIARDAVRIKGQDTSWTIFLRR